MSGEVFAALGERRRWVLAIAALGCVFLSMLDGTVVGTALPQITAGLGGSASIYVWTVTAYLVTSTVSVPIYGRLSDLYGRKVPLLVGLSVFLIGSLACRLATNLAELVALRAVQGLGAGALLTVAMAVVRDLFPPERMASMVRMQSALAVVMIVGLVGGPLVGGLIADGPGWRWAFLLNLPVGGLVGLTVALLLPRHRPATPSGSVDLAGAALLAVGLGSVLVGLSLAGHPGAHWSLWWVLLALVFGCCLLAMLPRGTARAAVPLVPLHLLRNRDFCAIAAAGFCFQVATISVGVFVPLLLQHAGGYSATASGLMLLPLMIGMTVGNRLTALAILRSGRARPALLTGAALVSVGTAGFLVPGMLGSPIMTAVLLIVIGLGSGPAMGGATIVAQSCVPGTDLGSATAGAALSKQLGGAFGLAVAQWVFSAAGGALRLSSAVSATVGGIGLGAGLCALLSLGFLRNVPLRTKAKPQPKQPAPA